MCNPAIFTAVGMSAQAAATASTIAAVATTAATVAQQKQQQKLQIKAAENQADAAVREYNYSQKNLENEAISQADATANELFNANIEAARARSSAVANAAGRGVTGQSVDALGNELDSIYGRQVSDIETNYDIYKQSSQSQSEANYRTLTSALTGLGGEVQGPGFLSSTLKIGAAGAGAYADAEEYNKKLTSGYIDK